MPTNAGLHLARRTGTATMNFAPYIEKIRPRLDDRIAELLRPVAFNQETTEMILRGKRLRGGLLLVVHEALTASEADDVALDLAAAIELAHASSLILDDVIDEDEERRGAPALHMTFGQKQALLEAIGVLSIPYRVVAPHGTAYVRHLAETQIRMASGASVEVSAGASPSASDLYDAIITRKTAELFGLAAFWGAISAGCTDDGYRRFGVHCGRILQIVDDAADFYAFLAGKRQHLTGSELLLLRAVTAERGDHGGEYSVSAANRASQSRSTRWMEGQVQRWAETMLDRETACARGCLTQVVSGDQERFQILWHAPAGIAAAMVGSLQERGQAAISA